MTEYEITRIASEIVKKLINDERFIRHIAKVALKEENLVSSVTAAEILGVSRDTVVRNAKKLGGMMTATGRYVFPRNGLVKKFQSR